MPDQPHHTLEQIAPGLHTPAGFTRATHEIRRLMAELEAVGLSPAALSSALLTETMPRLVAVHGSSRCAELLGSLALGLRLDDIAAGPASPRWVS
ncbi:hypothetical protein [Inquilinus limosus]|uniref:Uncharacterized protein n=1 Tax=Inquilinus limosus MP06 TaxID=1398085 RepID=A0A0A0D5Z5_9PROT|nr:hypothetical protein [Inquilinus limosus]KGM34106.1 hypothetical protein P409_12070 [Inquilinus limosus MP06]